MLVTKSETRTGLTLAICFGTLTADGFLFITLELPLTASQAGFEVSLGIPIRGARVETGRRTNQSETSCLWDVIEWQCHVEYTVQGEWNNWV